MTDNDEDMFARWSRRKRRVADENARDEAREAAVPEVGPAPGQSPPEEDEDEAALLERLQLPLPESLKAGDDFSLFMRAGVPEFLRRRALRVLWRSNPVLANLDGLNDYDADFTSPELTKAVLATGYKIGRGFLKEEVVPEIMQEKDTERENEAQSASDLSDQNSEESVTLSGPEESPSATSDNPPSDTEIPFNPKRMRFES